MTCITPTIGTFYRASIGGFTGEAVAIDPGIGCAYLVTLRSNSGTEKAFPSHCLGPPIPAAKSAKSDPSPDRATSRTSSFLAIDDPADTSEAAEGRRFIAALAALAVRYPEIGELVTLADGTELPGGWRVRHNSNGGSRGGREGADLKLQGVRAGVPDYTLDIARMDAGRGILYHGWHGELKQRLGGTIRESQHLWIESLHESGYWVGIHHGHEALLRDLELYLCLPSVPASVWDLARMVGAGAELQQTTTEDTSPARVRGHEGDA